MQGYVLCVTAWPYSFQVASLRVAKAKGAVQTFFRMLVCTNTSLVIVSLGIGLSQLQKPFLNQPFDLADNHRVDHIRATFAMNPKPDQVVHVGDDFGGR